MRPGTWSRSGSAIKAAAAEQLPSIHPENPGSTHQPNRVYRPVGASRGEDIEERGGRLTGAPRSLPVRHRHVGSAGAAVRAGRARRRRAFHHESISTPNSIAVCRTYRGLRPAVIPEISGQGLVDRHLAVRRRSRRSVSSWATGSPIRGSGDRPINPGAAIGSRPPGPAHRSGQELFGRRRGNGQAAAEGFDGRAERQTAKEDTMAINARVGIIGGNGGSATRSPRPPLPRVRSILPA